jgi:hypothetical protein
MAIIQEVQNQTNQEFSFRYVYDTGTKSIKRYIDFNLAVTNHTEPIELGYNASNIDIEIDETDVAIGAGPIGKPSSDTSTFHQSLKAFEDQAFSTGVQIPLYVTKEDNGNPVNGPNASPPYNKPAGQGFVVCDNNNELVASYQKVYSKYKSAYYPRINTFETSEENKYNLYWLCVDAIRQHLKPDVTISIDLVDLKALTGSSENYNIGDAIFVRLPGRDDLVECRISKTTKDPRHPEDVKIEISTYKTTFMQSFFRNYFKSPGAIDIG